MIALIPKSAWEFALLTIFILVSFERFLKNAILKLTGTTMTRRV
ncbi:hypothetical protein SAMN02745215_00260 [Desulfitobacterium chlororespirans DSM 11544]|uniref:Uncharacterized protein n=1 Tax=Desulfitobacterium chlororespirans DSM 11544 TaxID=1121395 RepID=A0A1M7RYM7_9FIRM|nr:hypothetical protein SAMN02745215_00260 [Desulfitobacterium chlororespirans DSM 11544]